MNSIIMAVDSVEALLPNAGVLPLSAAARMNSL